MLPSDTAARSLVVPADDQEADDHGVIVGSNRSAPRVALLTSSSFTDPPSAKTFPFGRSTEFPWTRAPDGILPEGAQVGLGWEMSMISVVAVAVGSPPPRIITRGA